MSYPISAISLQGESSPYTFLHTGGKISTNLEGLNKINVFVGPNNSGKSRLMRHLASTQKLRFQPSVAFSEFNTIRTELINEIEKFTSAHKIDDIGDLRRKLPGLPELSYVEEDASYSKDLFSLVDGVYNNNPLSTVRRNTRTASDAPLTSELRKALKPLKVRLDAENAKLPSQFKFKKLYIPSLRGLRPFDQGKDHYGERSKKDYFPKTAPNIFTGLQLYSRVRDLLLGDLDDRDKVLHFQEFLANSFFQGKAVALIPRRDSDVLFVKIGSEREYPIFDLGDGIQSVITIAFPLFESQTEDLVVFIEEPELYMHPGFQRILLNTLTSFSRHQYFVTTHSNHFLDLTLDYSQVSVFSFTKHLGVDEKRNAPARFEVQNISNDMSCTLELLGARNSSVLLTNCTIWVEGVTDRRYFGHYLRLYQESLMKRAEQPAKQFKEDLHFSFVEYSGGNITHWSFLEEEGAIDVKRLCGRLFLVTDRDDEKNEAKAKRRETLKRSLGDRYYCLTVREVENLLAPEILRKVVASYEKEIPTFPTFAQADYATEKLGRYIEDVLLGGKKTRNGAYADDSGTIAQKNSFCDRAIDAIRSYSEVSEEAKLVTEKIYAFVERHNA